MSGIRIRELAVAFCDDDAAFRSLMAEAVGEAFSRNGVAVRGSETAAADELLALLEHRSFDLLFLDIDMPGMDGIRLGEALRVRGFGGDIIYVSNMDDKVYEIFGAHPWSFMRKSRFADELGGVVAEYVRALRARSTRFVAEDAQGQTRSFAPEEILYAEAAGKTQKLFTTAQAEPILLRSSMRRLDDALEPMGFIRVHKGFLVNYRYIRKITSRSVLMDTGADLPVGRDRLNEARERYLALMKWKGLDRSL